MHTFMDLVYWVIAVSVEAGGQGKKIEAIKLCRERMGIGLKDAKDHVEALMDKSFSEVWKTILEPDRSDWLTISQTAITAALTIPLVAETNYKDRYEALYRRYTEVEAVLNNLQINSISREDFNRERSGRRDAEIKAGRMLSDLNNYRRSIGAQAYAIGQLSGAIRDLTSDPYSDEYPGSPDY